MTLILEIPDTLAAELGAQPTTAARTVLEGCALEQYRGGKFTKAQVGEMLGHSSRWETDAFLTAHRARGFSTELDLDEGLANLENFLASAK
jgi:hypothetical protein